MITWSNINSLFGIQSTALQWFQSYLSDISPLQSKLRLRHHHSSWTVCLRVQYWGPFSSSCTLHLSDIIARHSVKQMTNSSRNPLLSVKNSMHAPRPRHNDHGWPKISSNWTTTKQKLFSFPFRLPWNPASTVSLPDWFDSYSWLSHPPSLILPGTLDQFIPSLTQNCPRRSMSVIKSCQTANFELKCISSIRRFFTKDAAKTRYFLYPLTVHDYCNRLLMGTSNCHPTSPENSKLCCKTRSLGTPPPTRHRLPIWERIKYKVACVCFKAINGSGPAYLSATATCLHSVPLLTHACPKSNNTNTRLVAFAPILLWTSHLEFTPTRPLCSTPSSFKAKLKTFLFLQYFRPN